MMIMRMRSGRITMAMKREEIMPRITRGAKTRTS